MKRLLAALALAFASLVLVLMVNASRPLPEAPRIALAAAGGDPVIDEQAALDRFAHALQFKTVSYAERERLDTQAFADFRAWLREAWPRVFERLDWEEINTHSLLGRWAAPGGASTPAMFTAHYDVVPVDAADRDKWSEDPFGGERREGFVWGRGALDDKLNATAILEAIDLLLAEGWEPSRELYFAFGHDEELGGDDGAGKIAETLAARGTHFEFIVDEGGAITLPGLVPGVKRPLAMVGIAEKGYLTLELVAHASGGHSSTPKADSAILRLARALDALDEHQFPQSFEYLRAVGEGASPELDLPGRLVARNLWLFGPALSPWMRRFPEIDAMTRTTIAPTMLSAGIKDNVQPTEAHAVVNLRLLPGWSVEAARARVADIVADFGVEVEVRVANEASPGASSTTSRGWAMLNASIEQAWHAANPGAAPLTVVPFLTMGGTDLKNYHALSDDQYRFGFVPMAAEDFRRVHGIDERIAEPDYIANVRFFYHVLRNSGEMKQ